MDTPLERPLRIDALPEYSEYADTGCDFYPSCLHCPLPKCRFDERGGAAAMLRGGRDAAIVRIAARGDATIEQLAEMFGLSRRTIFRVLRTGRKRSLL